jgi:D-beta-D-heptose 7-phosphate kinase/D-beta-D-heptose 1-phosphate adenosyltransferase
MTKDQFLKLARQFPTKEILVIGDVMLDEFLFGEVSRISPEAPVPIVEVRREVSCLGGAANVARNIRSIGGNAMLVGVIGQDGDSDRILSEMAKQRMETLGLVRSRTRHTTKKTRIIAGVQQVCRADHEDRTPLSSGEVLQICKLLDSRIPHSDGVIVSDYAKGLINPEIFRQVVVCCKRHRKLLVVDPKIRNFSFYRDSTVITPNQSEAETAAQVDIHDGKSLAQAGEKLLKITRAQAVLITRGKDGMSLFERGREARHLPTAAREVFDVTGAGDTVVATLALAASLGASIANAADIANHAAGIVVGKLGTATASIEEIVESL